MCVEAGVPYITKLLNAGGFETLRKDFPPKWWFNKLAVCFYKLSCTFLFFLLTKEGEEWSSVLSFSIKRIILRSQYKMLSLNKMRWIRLLDLEKERNSNWLIQLDTNKSLAHKSFESTTRTGTPYKIVCQKYSKYIMYRNTVYGRLQKALKIHHVQEHHIWSSAKSIENTPCYILIDWHRAPGTWKFRC